MVKLIEHTSTLIELLFEDDIHYISYMKLERLENGNLNRESHVHEYIYDNKSILIKHSNDYIQIILVLNKINDNINKSTITINKKDIQQLNTVPEIKEI
jgi:hypothetical protein